MSSRLESDPNELQPQGFHLSARTSCTRGRLRAGRALLLAGLEHDVHAVPDLPDEAHCLIGKRPARCG
jgi:hypothetical protein